MPIDAKVEAEKLLKMYKEDPHQGKATILITGESGTGKTYGGRFCPFPMHIDSFDPGGSKSLRDEILKGNIVVDTRFEDEDPMNPTAFELWKKEFDSRRVGKYFESFATYMIDSGSTFVDSILNYVQASKKGSGVGNVPVWEKDYHPQKVEIRNWLRKCMNLPCHFILSGHIEPQKDKEGNIVARRFLMTGKGAITIPLLFDEIWVTVTKETSSGIDYRYMLESTGMYLARSRLAATGKLNKTEPQNIRNLLKKAGLNWEDKPKLF